MMNNRTKQTAVRVAPSSRPGRERYWVGNLATSLLLMGSMVVMQMMSVVPGATAAVVTLSSTAKAPTCEFTLSDAKPALKSVDASAVRLRNSVELGHVTLTLANCMGTLAGSNKSLQVDLSGTTQKSLGGTVRYDEYLFRDSSSTAKNIGFGLKWASTTAPWSSLNITGPTQRHPWPGSANADLTKLATGANKSVTVAYSLTSGENALSTVTAGTVKSTLTITLSIA